MSVKLFGRIPDPAHAKQFVSTLANPTVPKRLLRQVRKGQDVMLWLAKDKAEPTWRRKQQAIGDCVSWGAELACTCLLWNQAASGISPFLAEVATESIYGGCRVEIYNKGRVNNDEDGAAGSWAAEWLQKFGVLLRLDYSAQTGNQDHNLEEYSGNRAQDWGKYGCGGREDKDALDNIAKVYPVQDVTQVQNADDAEAALAHGCSITVASNVGYEGHKDADGIKLPHGTWGHQMCILGVKYMTDGSRLFRIFQSWGDSEEGPDPGIDDPAIKNCSWWTTEQSVNRMFGEDDSYAFSNVKGFVQAPYDFGTGLLV